MSETKPNTTILVFIKSEYIRDAQAYIGNKLPKNKDEIYMDCENEQYWQDTSPHGFVAFYNEKTIKEAKESIKTCYPNADEDIFLFLPVTVTSEETLSALL